MIFLLAAALLTVSAFACSDEECAVLDAADVDASVFGLEEAAANVDAINIAAPSAILMEKETGTIIYEKNADERLSPASVTKVMTILLIVEAVENGTVSLDDMVTVSAHAAGMGGSQIFLEEGEQMTAGDMLKSIVVSSANDAAVAMAEHICGTEEAFAEQMNRKAEELGMINTTFLNCTGLSDPTEHLTTARDIAIMSQALIKHDWIKEYTTIWMDTIRDGEFGLSNTNKLIRFYDGATGLKTGFTSGAKYCLAATAEKDGVEYIAVVMHCETSVDRFESAKTLLSYGFANYTLVSAVPDTALLPIEVKLGVRKSVQPELKSVSYILVNKSVAQSLTKKVTVCEYLTAPVEAGTQAGTLTISDGEHTIAEVPIIVADGVSRLSLGQIFLKLLSQTFLGGEI